MQMTSYKQDADGINWGVLSEPLTAGTTLAEAWKPGKLEGVREGKPFRHGMRLGQFTRRVERSVKATKCPLAS